MQRWEVVIECLWQCEVPTSTCSWLRWSSCVSAYSTINPLPLKLSLIAEEPSKLLVKFTWHEIVQVIFLTSATKGVMTNTQVLHFTYLFLFSTPTWPTYCMTIGIIELSWIELNWIDLNKINTTPPLSLKINFGLVPDYFQLMRSTCFNYQNQKK